MTQWSKEPENSNKRALPDYEIVDRDEVKRPAMNPEARRAFRELMLELYPIEQYAIDEGQYAMVKRSRRTEGMGGASYWASITEVGARSFQQYVMEKLRREGVKNTVLSNVWKGAMAEDGEGFISSAELDEKSSLPYLTKEEMDRVYPLFEAFFAALKHEPTSDGSYVTFSVTARMESDPDKVRVMRFVDEMVGSAVKDKTVLGAVEYREVTDREVADIKEGLGVDVSGMVHEVPANGIAHALRKHGNDSAVEQDQTDLTPQDVKLMLDVIDNYDRMEFKPKTGRNKSSVVYVKEYPHGVIYAVEQVIETTLRRSKKPRLVLKTGWKKVAASTGVESSAPAVYTPQRRSDGIPREPGDVNVSFSVIGPHAKTWSEYEGRARNGRVEIDASQAKLVADKWGELVRNEIKGDYVRLGLGELLDYEELYRAYPDLRDFEVRVFKEGGRRSNGAIVYGSISSSKGDNKPLCIKFYLDAIKNNERIMFFTALHELQHYIQFKEGWRNPVDQQDLNGIMLPDYKDLKSRLTKAGEQGRISPSQWDDLNDDIWIWDTYYLELARYLSLPYEVEARTVERRMELSAWDRERRPWEIDEAAEFDLGYKIVQEYDQKHRTNLSSILYPEYEFYSEVTEQTGLFKKEDITFSVAARDKAGNRLSADTYLSTPDGRLDWFVLPKHDRKKRMPVRLKVGEDRGEHKGYGLTHIVAQRGESGLWNRVSPAKYLGDILANASELYVQNDREVIVRGKSPKSWLVVQLEEQDNQYSIVTAYPVENINKKPTGRRIPLSARYSLTSDKETPNDLWLATAEAIAQVAQGNDAPAKVSQETTQLADRESEFGIPQGAQVVNIGEVELDFDDGNVLQASFSVIGKRAKTWSEYEGRTFKGRDDGELRAELDTSKARLKRFWRWRFKQVGEKQWVAPLKKLLDFKELYRAYPQLANMKVGIINDGRKYYSGRYYPRTESIEINVAKAYQGGILAAVLHEVQHAIQDIEGWINLRDTDAEVLRNVLRSKRDELARLGKGAEEGMSHEEYMAATRYALSQGKYWVENNGGEDSYYWYLPWEIESRAIEKRMGYSAAERAAIPFNEDLEYKDEVLAYVPWRDSAAREEWLQSGGGISFSLTMGSRFKAVERMQAVEVDMPEVFNGGREEALEVVEPHYRELQKLSADRGYAFVMKDGTKVKVSGRGFGKVKSHSADRRMVAALGVLEKLAESAEYMYSAPNSEADKKSGVERYYYYLTKGQFNGEDSYVLLTIEEHNNGEYFYDLDALEVAVADNIKDSAQELPATRVPNAGQVTLGESDKSRIAWIKKHVIFLEEIANDMTFSVTGEQGAGASPLGGVSFRGVFTEMTERMLPKRGESVYDAVVDKMRGAITRAENRLLLFGDKRGEGDWSEAVQLLLESKELISSVEGLLPRSYGFGLEPYKTWLDVFALMIAEGGRAGDANGYDALNSALEAIPAEAWRVIMSKSVLKRFGDWLGERAVSDQTMWKELGEFVDLGQMKPTSAAVGEAISELARKEKSENDRSLYVRDLIGGVIPVIGLFVGITLCGG